MNTEAHYKMSPADTKEVKRIMNAAGLDVSMCRLGSNKFYAQLHTSDNKKAVEVLTGTKFSQSYLDKNTPAEIRNIVDIMIHKTEA